VYPGIRCTSEQPNCKNWLSVKLTSSFRRPDIRKRNSVRLHGVPVDALLVVRHVNTRRLRGFGEFMRFGGVEERRRERKGKEGEECDCDLMVNVCGLSSRQSKCWPGG
jgi:hypothetical protein